MNLPTSGLLPSLTLSDTGARTREDIFTGENAWMPHGRLFGGQVLAQSLVAAIRTVSEDRQPHSLHGYFLRPGQVEIPTTYAVDRIYDGRSFSTRRTQAYQDGVPILSMIASFQREDVGIDHQIQMPAVPEPETLSNTADWLAVREEAGAHEWALVSGFDFRQVETAEYVAAESAERAPVQAVWMRASEPLPDDPNTHRAALLYASDWLVLEPVRRRHKVPWADPRIKGASLDHAMWWHRPARADEWLLFTQESPTATGGRGLGLGYIFRRDGELVATVAQEGMMRVPGELLDRAPAGPGRPSNPL